MVKELLDELLPARLLLDDADRDRWIQIERASNIDFVAGSGLRVATRGEVRWQAAGLPIGFTFTSARLMIQPMVVEDERGGRLVFRPTLESLDLRNVPAFLDSGVLALINNRLVAQGDALAWHFGQALARTFGLPAIILPLVQLKLGAQAGVLEVLDDALTFSLSLAVRFAHGGA